MVAVYVLAGSGCLMTREEGAQLQRDQRTLERELIEIQLAQQRREKALVEKLTEAESRMHNVKSSLEQVDNVARRADADFFLKLDDLVLQVKQLSGRIEEMEHRLAQMDQLTAALDERTPDPGPPTKDPPQAHPAEPAGQLAIPEDKQALYDLAKQTLDAGDHTKARELFGTFVSRFPGDAVLSDNALYWTGECYFKENIFDKAILTFQKVINTYPKSDKTDAALYKIGRSFEALGLRDDAVLFYDDLIAKFPRSNLVTEAKRRIQDIRKDSKKKKKKNGAR